MRNVSAWSVLLHTRVVEIVGWALLVRDYVDLLVQNTLGVLVMGRRSWDSVIELTERKRLRRGRSWRDCPSSDQL